MRTASLSWKLAIVALCSASAACVTLQRVPTGTYVHKLPGQKLSIKMDLVGRQLTLRTPAGKPVNRRIVPEATRLTNPCPTQGLKSVVHEWFRISGGPLTVGNRTLSDPILVAGCFGKSVVLTQASKVSGRGEVLSVDLSGGVHFAPVRR